MSTLPARVLSGLRPTSRLHIGNYKGAIENWVKLQESGKYQCYYTLVDWHALTTHYADPHEIRQNILALTAEWIACGIDPAKAVIFVQSAVKTHAELHLLFSMITPVPWLERVPTYKEVMQALSDRDLRTYGFLGYPVLQTADIAIYRAQTVPVGEDQVAHLELSREIIRRFNGLYGETFPEPKPLLTPVPRIPGMDGRKMSKSLGNAIWLYDTPADIEKKILPMVTDPARKTRKDPGTPEICPVFDLHKAFSDAGTQDEVAQGCRTAGIGCIDCKKKLLGHLIPQIAPLSEKIHASMQKPAELDDILATGAKAANAAAEETMALVREKIFSEKPMRGSLTPA